MEAISFQENQEGFFADSLIDPRIEKVDFTLKKDENFKTSLKKELFRKLSRKNILKFGIMTGEEPVAIEHTDGSVMLRTVNTDQIQKRIYSFSEDDRRKIQYIHISTVQVIIKSTFMKGIDSPLQLTLRDSRLRNVKEGIIAEGFGNISKGKIMFNINLQIGLSLADKNLDRSIVLHYNFLKRDFMKEGNHPFSICYKVNYALSNSHHSIEFIGKETIEIDDLFKEIVSFKSPVLQKIDKTTSILSSDERIFEIGSSSRFVPPREIRISESPSNLTNPLLVEKEDEKEILKLQKEISNMSKELSLLNNKI